MMDRLDHGFLNIPLAKRGNIDAQIDRYKAQQARTRKAADTARYHETREKQTLVKQMVADLSDERVMELARPLGCRKPSTARAAICQAAKSNLDRFINVLWKEFHNCGNCASWRGGECWSPDRLDDPSKGSAGATYARDTCEAWREASKCPPDQPTALVEVAQEDREALQEAWDSYPFGLPPIIFTDAEADYLISAIRKGKEGSRG